VPDEPVPYYPEMRCHMAPLPPGQAPEDGCICRVCDWARASSDRAALDSATGPVTPGTPAWYGLLALARD
jgi:hypothetical protein